MAPQNTSRDSNRYTSTPRKVFDKHVDRIEIRRQRDREDHRNDIAAVMGRVQSMEAKLTLLTEQHDDLERHVASHCTAIDLDKHDTEELE